jgi:uncharacterized protein YprB with RNaseH-like and TPR domain
MINKTFCHIEGVSKDTEKILWQNQILDWDTFLEKHSEINFLPQSKIDKIKTELFFSKQNLEENNIKYFKTKLDTNEHWRLHENCKIAFVDIETTGLSRYTDEITMIGIYDGEIAKSYIQGVDLEKAKEHLKQFDIIVTFNGKTFDMPFIEYKFREKYDIIHLDLRWMLKEFGLTGGLKKIEIELGITRPEEIMGVDGFEAVRLWRRYKRGDEKALQTLLKYNYEDIVNLKTILDYYILKKTNEYEL